MWHRNSQGVSPKRLRKRPHKTAKRRAAKQAKLLGTRRGAMLAKKNNKKSR